MVSGRSATVKKPTYVNVDEDGFIKAIDYTDSLRDSSCFPGLFTGEESAADDDSALELPGIGYKADEFRFVRTDTDQPVF